VGLVLELAGGEVAVAGRDGLEFGAVDGDELTSEETELSAVDDELTSDTADGLGVVLAEVSDSLEVGRQTAQEPHEFNISIGISLELAAGADAVEVTVDVEAQEVGRVVGRTSPLKGDSMGEVQAFQVERGDEGVDEADGVVLADVVVEGFREEGQLVPVVAFDVPHPPPPRGQGDRHDLPYITPDFSHRLSLEPRRTARTFGRLGGLALVS
jgi:hypothetical protein